MLEIYYPKKNVVNCNENENRLCFTKMCLSSKSSVSLSHPIFQEIPENNENDQVDDMMI